MSNWNSGRSKVVATTNPTQSGLSRNRNRRVSSESSFSEHDIPSTSKKRREPSRIRSGRSENENESHDGARTERRVVEAGPSRLRGNQGPSHSQGSGLGDPDFGAATQGAEDEEEESEEEEDDFEGLTVDTYVERGIKNTPTILKQLDVTQQRYNSFIETYTIAIEKITETATALEDCRGGGMGKELDDEMEQEATNLEKTVKSHLDKIAECKIQQGVLKDLIKRLTDGEEVMELDKTFRRLVDDKVDKYLSQSERAKYKKSELYKEFKNSIWVINHDQVCPPISDFLKAGEGDVSDDEEIELGGQTQDFKCPITLMAYNDAHSSTKCVHSYTGEAIREHLQNRPNPRQPAKCPVAGCSALLTEKDIKRNPELQKKSDLAKRRQERRLEEEENGHDAELIE